MLVLQVKHNEPVHVILPDGRMASVKVLVVRSGGQFIRLGFEGPRDITVIRQSVLDQLIPKKSEDK